MIILGPKTAILGPQFCRILVLGPHFWWSGGPGPPGPPLDPPLYKLPIQDGHMKFRWLTALGQVIYALLCFAMVNGFINNHIQFALACTSRWQHVGHASFKVNEASTA